MKPVLFRGRIRGITHRKLHSTLIGRTPGTNKPVNSDNFALTEAELKSALPQPFSHSEIYSLLCDLGRQRLHTLVSDCIDHTSHWRQVSSVLDRQLNRVQNSQIRKMESSSDLLLLNGDDAGYWPGANTDPRQWLALEVKRVYRLWKHRLSMLEMIADAQNPAQWEMRFLKNSKKK